MSSHEGLPGRTPVQLSRVLFASRVGTFELGGSVPRGPRKALCFSRVGTR
jgi:hypothetical protein